MPHYLDNYSRPLVSLPDGFRSALSCHGDLLNGPSSVDVTPVGYCPVHNLLKIRLTKYPLIIDATVKTKVITMFCVTVTGIPIAG